MAQDINLSQQPNQNVSILSGDNRYDIEVVAMGKTMGISIAVNGVQLVTGMRALPNTPILPYPYLALKAGGNFMFRINDGSYPWWENFGVSQPFVFADTDEIQAMIDALPNPLDQLGVVRTPYPRNTVDVLNSLIATGFVGDARTNFTLTYQGATVVQVLRLDGVYRQTSWGRDLLSQQPRQTLVYPTMPVSNGGSGSPWVNYNDFAVGAVVTVTPNQADPYGGTNAAKIVCDTTGASGSVVIGIRFLLPGVNNAKYSVGCFLRGDAGGEVCIYGVESLAGTSPGLDNKILTTNWQRFKIENFQPDLLHPNQFDLVLNVPAASVQTFYVFGVNLVQEPSMNWTLINLGNTLLPAVPDYTRTNDATITIAMPALMDKEQLMWSGSALVNF